MGMNDLFGAAGAKPKLVTVITTGTGTYVPTADGARCIVRIQAGGGGALNNCGGGGGGMVEVMLRVPIAGLPYVVGAGGTNAPTAGGDSKFGSFVAMGGGAAVDNASSQAGGHGGGTGKTLVPGYSTISVGGSGVVGGAGGGSIVGGPSLSASAGCAPGFSAAATSVVINWTNIANGSAAASGTRSGGGDSFFGKGGAGNNAGAGNPGTGYGGGGGAGSTVGGAGSGGCIEILDYGV